MAWLSADELKKRPVLRLRYSKAELVLEMFGVLGLLGMFALIYLAWPHLPAEYVASPGGQPHEKAAIFTMPIMGVVLYALFSLMFFFPNYLNYFWVITKKNAEAQYRNMRLVINWTKMVMAWMLCYQTWNQIRLAEHRITAVTSPVGYIFFAALVVGLIIYFIAGSRAK